MLGLGEEKRGVEPLLSHQLVMGSLFHNLAVIDDNNTVGHFYSRQSMADQSCHTPLSQDKRYMPRQDIVVLFF